MSALFDWKAWRRAERERLIADRLSLSVTARQEIGSRIAATLEAVLPLGTGTTLSFYWPFKGELDLRDWISGLQGRGIRSALPVVTEKNAPMTFRLWTPGIKMERGIWNIPVPAPSPPVEPAIVIAPLVGFDAACFRLGYSGGYFDRTLAALPAKPLVVGIGYASSILSTIHPQSHDIPMDMIVTETNFIRR